MRQPVPWLRRKQASSSAARTLVVVPSEENPVEPRRSRTVLKRTWTLSFHEFLWWWFVVDFSLLYVALAQLDHLVAWNISILVCAFINAVVVSWVERRVK